MVFVHTGLAIIYIEKIEKKIQYILYCMTQTTTTMAYFSWNPNNPMMVANRAGAVMMASSNGFPAGPVIMSGPGFTPFAAPGFFPQQGIMLVQQTNNAQQQQQQQQQQLQKAQQQLQLAQQQLQQAQQQLQQAGQTQTVQPGMIRVGNYTIPASSSFI